MNQSMLFSFFNPSVLLLLYLLVVLIFFVHRELLHLPNDRRGVERSLPLAFDEVFLHLCTDRGMNISVQGGVTRNPTMQKTKLGQIHVFFIILTQHCLYNCCLGIIIKSPYSKCLIVKSCHLSVNSCQHNQTKLELH